MKSARRPRPGMVLVLVLVVIALLTLSAYTFSELMFSEHRAARSSIRVAQARATAESGIEFARLMVGKDTEEIRDAGGLYDNAEQFQGMLVLNDEDDSDRSRFTIVAPAQVDGVYEGLRHGLENESTRINLAMVLAADKKGENGGREMLMKLPGMTEQIADSILDWIDSDDDTREYGAEKDYYASLDPPYVPRNGMPQSIEELLLVQGVTPELLFGLDTNHNGILDADEGQSASISTADNSDGSMNRGWAAYLTIYSAEANLRPDGEAKVNVNGSDLETLYSDLQEAVGEDWAKYIVLYRQNGAYSSSGTSERSSSRSSTETVSISSATLDFTKKANKSGKISTLLDLVGTRVKVGERKVQSGRTETRTIALVADSPFSKDTALMGAYMPKMLQNMTTSKATSIPGRININQAPRLVLKMIPNMTDEMIDEIISRRHENPIDDTEDHNHEAWILTEGIVTLAQMKKLLPMVTVGGSVYRAQVIGYYDGRGPAARLEAVFDATSKPARMLFLRDLTHLGRGFTLDALGQQAF